MNGLEQVIQHYDLLIEEENDPFRDPPALRDYMSRWDGPEFFNALDLSPHCRALEIGIGTGRLAAQTAPLCKRLTGIDCSKKSLCRARENLRGFSNIDYLLGDFLTYPIPGQFERIYSVLTFPHIKDKRAAVQKISILLAPGGKVVLSLDKNQREILDYGSRSLRVYPDRPDRILALFKAFGLKTGPVLETEFAFLVTGTKESSKVVGQNQ